MACFWNSVIISLQRINLLNTNMTPKLLSSFLRQNNMNTPSIKWNDNYLFTQELDENFQYVENYDYNLVGQYHPGGASDPFLFLVASIFNVDIVCTILHNTKVSYMHDCYDQLRPILYFNISDCHFSI